MTVFGTRNQRTRTILLIGLLSIFFSTLGCDSKKEEEEGGPPPPPKRDDVKQEATGNGADPGEAPPAPGGDLPAANAGNPQAPKGIWTDAIPLDQASSQGADYTDIASDSAGNGIAVWREKRTVPARGLQFQVVANRYTVGSGWSGPEVIANPALGDIPEPGPKIAMDANGNAFVVWSEKSGTQFHIRGRRYLKSSGRWEPAFTINQNVPSDDRWVDLNATYPKISMEPSGNRAVVVWNMEGLNKCPRGQVDCRTRTSYGLRARVFKERGWEDTQFVSPTSMDPIRDASIVVHDGKALVIWSQSNPNARPGDRDNDPDKIRRLWYSSYHGTRWGLGEPEMIDTTNAESPKIVMDSQWSGLVTWQEKDLATGKHTLKARRFSGFGGGFAGIRQLSEPAVDVLRSDTVMILSPVSQFMILWTQKSGADGISQVMNSTCPFGALCTGPVSFPYRPANARSPMMTVDQGGNLLAVWHEVLEGGAGSNIISRRYEATNGWGEVIPLTDNPAQRPVWPKIATDTEGHTILIWEQRVGDHRIWARRFE
ncbi:MAG: hypothetical protein HYS22_06920 [Deltaproteobacteria bacterium]|nr:hypothetical protein [Deltaproteobacteria bacterium]